MTSAPCQRGLLTCGVAAGPLFVVVFLIEGVLRPDYSPMRQPVSSLSIGSTGWTQTANFLITGLLMLAFAFGLQQRDNALLLPILIGITGVGLIGASVFTGDPVNGYPPGTPMLPVATTSGTLHKLFSSLGFVMVPIGCLVAARQFTREGKRVFARYSVATVVAFIALYELSALGIAQNPTFLPLTGLMQRLCLAVAFAWLTILALRKMRQPDT
ncbi:MAG: DUF998 domain-containing protein [Mycobacterium sp.]